MKKIACFFFCFFISLQLFAWEEKFDIETIGSELRKPDVKLVAVDFYADSCEPCKKAIPKWKELQEKYGARGFKLIVVKSRDEKTGCSLPYGWSPDRIVCDRNGKIKKNWNVDAFPEAFLFSWMSESPVVSYSGVNEVENAVRRYFNEKAPRVYVYETDDRELYELVRYELENSKLEVVPPEEEQEFLARHGKRLNDSMRYDDDLKCKLGRGIPANSIMTIQKTWDSLILRLFSIEQKCSKASGIGRLRGDGNIRMSVEEAVVDLMGNLLGEIGFQEEQRSAGKNLTKYESAESDHKACEQARQMNNVYAWEFYLQKFPSGECAWEAQANLKTMKSLDNKLKNSYFFGEYDDSVRDPGHIAFWTAMVGMFPMMLGTAFLIMDLAIWDGSKDVLIPSVIMLGVGAPLCITSVTYAVWKKYTKGERAAGFMISFGALAAAGGGTMMGLADGNKSLLGGGIATAVVGAGMLAGGITMAIFDARARELKGTQPRTSFFVLPDKDGVYAQMSFKF